MSSHRISSRVALLALLLLSLSACKEKFTTTSPVLLRVDGRTVTLAQFQGDFAASLPADQSLTPEERKELERSFLIQVVDRELTLAEADHLHYLLKTPFRYFPPNPHGSRFRRPHDGRGVFYCAEKIRTALAELSYWRRRFIEASPGTPLPRNHEALTVFSIAYQVDLQLDLTLPPLVAERHLWTHPDDYTATQVLAESARDGGVKAIRYESVRDPKHGANLALLTPVRTAATISSSHRDIVLASVSSSAMSSFCAHQS